jgi:hypothetical protein
VNVEEGDPIGFRGPISARAWGGIESYWQQYLRQLRKAEGGLNGMNTAQAGNLVENLGSYNGLRHFRKHLYRLLYIMN